MQDASASITKSPLKYLKYLRELHNHPRTRGTVTFAWGGTGVGKTSVARQFAEELNAEFFQFEFSTMQSVDLMGGMEVRNGVTYWGKPYFFPRLEKAAAEGRPIVIHCDEVSSALPADQTLAYAIALERRINIHDIPGESIVLMSGNRDQDGAVTYQMPTPLRSRLVHVNIEPSARDFGIWGSGAGIHPDVIAFLGTYPSYLFDYRPKSQEQAFPNPRMWEVASNHLWLYDDGGLSDKNGQHSELMQALAGCVGIAAATEFLAWRQTAKKVRPVKDYINGEPLPHNSVGAMWVIANSLTQHVKEGVIPVNDALALITRPDFIDDRIQYGAMVAGQLIDWDFQEVSEAANYRGFISTYGDIISMMS